MGGYPFGVQQSGKTGNGWIPVMHLLSTQGVPGEDSGKTGNGWFKGIGVEDSGKTGGSDRKWVV